MQKKYNNEIDISNFIKDYSNGKIKTIVISNHLALKNIKNAKLMLELNTYKDFIYLNSDTNIIFNFISSIAPDALKNKFGKYDFKFSGNRDYLNYLLEFEGITIIAPAKLEAVVTDDMAIDDTLLKKLLNFEKTFNQFCIDYAIKNKDNLSKEFQVILDNMIEAKIIVNGKIKYHTDLNDFKTLPIFKMK